MSKTLLLFLSVAISAFMLGTTTLLFLDKRYVRVEQPQPKISDSSSDFLRLDDGTQICWGPLDIRQVAPNPPRGNIRDVVCTFPRPFNATPTVTLGLSGVDLPVYKEVVWAPYNQKVTSEGYTARLFGANPSPANTTDMSGDTIQARYIAVGRWK